MKKYKQNWDLGFLGDSPHLDRKACALLALFSLTLSLSAPSGRGLGIAEGELTNPNKPSYKAGFVGYFGNFRVSYP